MKTQAQWLATLLLYIFPTAVILGTPALVQPASSQTPAKPLHIVLVGDSTVSNYPPKHPNRGWGMYLAEQFKPGTVAVSNLAAPGRSTKTFIQEGRWTKALAEKPNYIFIQFGHNDSHDPKKPEATDPKTDYQQYLARLVDETRAIKATPILVTPMVRRRFDGQGKIIDEPQPNRPLSAYAEAMRTVASEKRVALIDLYSSSLVLAEKLGPKESVNLASKPSDPTHFNEKGARSMLALIIEGLPAAAPKLSEALKAQ